MTGRTLFSAFALFLVVSTCAWALSDGDSGGAWIQAPSPQKIQVTNILSRDLGVDPGKLQECLEKTFAKPANVGKSIREAAHACKTQQQQP